MNNDNKIYVWRGFNPSEYVFDGQDIALASSEEEAKELVIKKLGFDIDDPLITNPDNWGDLTIYDLNTPFGIAIWGLIS